MSLPLPRGFLNSRDEVLTSLIAEFMPAQSEFSNNTSASPCLCTPILDNSRVRVPVERVELELSLIPDLRRERLVAGHEEVSAADDFGVGHASSGLHIASKMDVPLHGLDAALDDEYGSKVVEIGRAHV